MRRVLTKSRYVISVGALLGLVPGTFLEAVAAAPSASMGRVPTHTALSRGDLTAQPFLRATNARGPAERGRSNGEAASGDGRALTLNGRVYARGLGVHAGSSLSFALGGRCRIFMTRVGVDDEVGDRGSVVFQVYADGVKAYDSGRMTGRSATKTVIVPVKGAGELRLVVTDAGDGNSGDHADWVSPQLLGCALAPAPRAAARTPASGLESRRSGIPRPPARPAAPQAPISGPVVYRGPITITRGGVYSGNWASSDTTPAVTVKTSEPVVIENARLRGRGDLVRGFGVNLTLRGVQGENLPPSAAGRAPGHAVLVEEIQNLTVENSSFVRGGIYVRKFLGRGTQGIRIRRNTFANIDGRQSDGARGFSGKVDRRQMVQFNDVQGIPNAEIAWNQVVNRPGESAVEDNINLFASSGTPGNPILIHDNYIQGAYPMNPGTQKGYSGGGIMLGDGKVTSPLGNGYVRAYGNQIVSTTNYGIAIAGGSGIEAYGNRVVSSGRLPDGRPIAAANVGMYVWDINGASNLRPATFARNVLRDNVSGWTRVGADGRENNNPMWLPHCTLNGSRCANNRDLGKVTLATERAEWDLWQQKLRAAGVVVGAR